MGKIRNKLKENKKIYGFVKVMQLFKRGMAWRILSDYATNPKVITFNHYGDNNPTEKLYHITVGNTMTGMCSLLTWTLRKLEYAEFFNLTPYVSWKKGVTVADRDYAGNPFELYFMQTTTIGLKELSSSANVAKSREIDQVYEDRLKSYNFSDDEIERLAQIYEKYIKLQSDLSQKIQTDIDSLLGQKKGKILAVHVRGADWRKKHIDGHPVVASEEHYIHLVDEFMKKNEYEGIFLATDSESTVEMFQSYFKERVLFYNDVNRTPKDGDSLVIFDSSRNPVDMGNEILRDVYTMAACDSIISGISYVSYIVRILKRSRKESFEEIIIADNGIASNSHSLRNAERKQRRTT